jgi:hypothetical protein
VTAGDKDVFEKDGAELGVQEAERLRLERSSTETS